MKYLLVIFLSFFTIILCYSQDEKTVVETGALILKTYDVTNPVAGTIRWTGTDFEGFNGTEWISFTGGENETNLIEIGSYAFSFPPEFIQVRGQGIDSSIGNINGDGISLAYDYGWYTRPSTNLPETEYLIIEDEINGHFRQIVKPVDPNLNTTKIHLYNISEQTASPYGYNSLSITVKNITVAQQEMIIDVFNAVEIIE